MDQIVGVHAREVLDSRGWPTVEAEVFCAGGALGRAIVPAGASTGRAEAQELRDGDPRRFAGRGVLQAVGHVNTVLGPALYGVPATDQAAVDGRLKELDRLHDGRLGANALLAVSLAALHAAAAARQVPLFVHLAALAGTRGDTIPLPLINVLSGGRHADHVVDIQDYMVVPVGAPDYRAALEMVSAVIGQVRARFLTRGWPTGLADEGGYAPPLVRNEDGLALLVEAIEQAGYRPGEDLALAVDVAASQLTDGDGYRFTRESRSLSRAEMVAYLAELARRWPLVSIEDGLGEDDWTGWADLTRALGHRIQLVGDDLFVTQENRLRRGIDAGIANAVLIKPNQVGTLTDTLGTMALAQRHGYRTIVSARSGETEDTTIADLAVGTDAGQIKIGSLQRSSRLAKYNQLLRIAEWLGPRARWARRGALAPDRASAP